MACVTRVVLQREAYLGAHLHLEAQLFLQGECPVVAVAPRGTWRRSWLGSMGIWTVGWEAMATTVATDRRFSREDERG